VHVTLIGIIMFTVCCLFYNQRNVKGTNKIFFSVPSTSSFAGASQDRNPVDSICLTLQTIEQTTFSKQQTNTKASLPLRSAMTKPSTKN
jgi:hypothetical protein